MPESKITVVVTVFNEKNNIEALITSLQSQSLNPMEIIITDANSSDGTWEILTMLAQNYPQLKIYKVPGNRSKGRNVAIEKAKTEFIAVTDSGVIADYRWLEELADALEEGAFAVAGFYKPLTQNRFEEAVAQMTIPSLKTVDPKHFLPSSRSVAFRKTAWEKAGGYPENLSYNEDTPYDLALQKAGYEFVFVPEAIVYWRPRGSLKAVFRQFFYYALGDGEAGIQYQDYLPIFLRYLLLVLFPYGTYLAFVLWAIRFYRDLTKCRSLIFLPLRLTIDIADMSGFLYGRKEAWEKWRQKSSS